MNLAEAMQSVLENSRWLAVANDDTEFLKAVSTVENFFVDMGLRVIESGDRADYLQLVTDSQDGE